MRNRKSKGTMEMNRALKLVRLWDYIKNEAKEMRNLLIKYYNFSEPSDCLAPYSVHCLHTKGPEVASWRT